jgi:hypothetical protein
MVYRKMCNGHYGRTKNYSYCRKRKKNSKEKNQVKERSILKKKEIK